MLELKGKTAIVTCAASGIGLGIAKAPAGAGMSLVLADLQPDRLTAAYKDIEALGARAVGVPVDVSDAGSVAAAGRAAEQAFGKLHVAVNNAGVAMHGTRVEDAGIGVSVLCPGSVQTHIMASLVAAFDRAEAWEKAR